VGRPDLQTALASAAGIDLLHVAYRDALRLGPDSKDTYRREAIWIHETGFPRSVVVAARRRSLDSRALLTALRSRRAAASAYFSPRDPFPLVFEVGRLVSGIVSSAVRRACKR
jgi:predicted ATP-grasp superfamily ATP-dependent carboligase